MGRYEKYYRGFEKKYGSDRDHLLWVAYEPEYAAEYGDTMEEITIDDDKLKCVSLEDLEDYYEVDILDGPDEVQMRQLLDDGYNCYGFQAGYGDDCLCIWDRSVIVGRRVLSPQEVKSLIESTLRGLFRKFLVENGIKRHT